jgi:hypothetical protein
VWPFKRRKCVEIAKRALLGHLGLEHAAAANRALLVPWAPPGRHSSAKKSSTLWARPCSPSTACGPRRQAQRHAHENCQPANYARFKKNTSLSVTKRHLSATKRHKAPARLLQVSRCSPAHLKYARSMVRSASSLTNHLSTFSTFLTVRSVSPFLKRAAFSSSVRSYRILVRVGLGQGQGRIVQDHEVQLNCTLSGAWLAGL